KKHWDVILILYELFMKENILNISYQFQIIFKKKLENTILKRLKKTPFVSYIFRRSASDSKSTKNDIDFENLFQNFANMNEDLFIGLLLKYENNKKQFKEKCTNFYMDNGYSISELLTHTQMDKTSINLITILSKFPQPIIKLDQVYYMPYAFLARNVYYWALDKEYNVYAPFALLRISKIKTDFGDFDLLFKNLFSKELSIYFQETLTFPINYLTKKYIEQLLK
ncbi:hypothetical protein HZS_3965, partial [Henneguya salminicola]